MDKEVSKELETIKPVHMMTPFEEMERMFEESFPRQWMRGWSWPLMGGMSRSSRMMAPRVDLIDRDDEVLLRAEVPGVHKEDLDISVTENTLTLHGSNNKEKKTEDGDYYCHEIAQGEFSRTVSLPGMVDTDKARAKFTDGLVEITIPKLSKSKRRHIPIN